MYGYKCEYCDWRSSHGIVQEQVVEQEVFKHRDGFVILENVPVGVCNKCGCRYYHSTLLHWVEEIATRKKAPKRMELVPVATFA
ncbi:MAG: YgiT-type zinc finger protein [Anaerolineae bacterium]